MQRCVSVDEPYVGARDDEDIGRYHLDSLLRMGVGNEPKQTEAYYSQAKERDAERLFVSNAWENVRCIYCPGEPKLIDCAYNHVVGYSPACGRSFIETKGERHGK